jgi:hypothetical protein
MVPRGNRITAHSIFSEPIEPVITKRSSSYYESQFRSYSSFKSCTASASGSASGSEEDYSCYICLETVQDPATVIYCMHSFCFDCIFTWYKISETCPVCKSTSASFLRNATHDNDCSNVNIWRCSNEPKVLSNGHMANSAIANTTAIHRKRFSIKEIAAEPPDIDQSRKRVKFS